MNSDKPHIARITELAEEIFGDSKKAKRWLCKPKQRLGALSPMEVMRTETRARLVEEMLLQFEHGFVA